MSDEPRYWYEAKRWWGYRHPLTWEGWVVDITLFAALLGMGPYVRARTHPLQSLGLFLGVLVLYAGIAHWKGEPNDWDS